MTNSTRTFETRTARQTRRRANCIRDGRQFLTSGDVAAVFECSPRTAANWLDTGVIPGAFRLPGSKDRRVGRVAVIDFAATLGVVLPGLADRPTAAVHVPDDPSGVCPAEAGAMAARRELAGVRVGCGDGLAAAVALARALLGIDPHLRLEMVLPDDLSAAAVPGGVFHAVTGGGA